MRLRIISLFVALLFISTYAHTIEDGNYEHLLEIITDLQSTVIKLEDVTCTQTSRLEHLDEKVEKLEEKQLEMEDNIMECERIVEEQNSTISQIQEEIQELAESIIECSCNSSPEVTTAQPTTMEPTTMEPTTTESTTMEPTTMEPTTMEPTTMEPTTMEPTTMEPTTMEPTTMEPTTPTIYPSNCQEIFSMGNIEDGVYTITVNNSPLQVYCEDGGWTVIQKRYDGSLSYDRSFDQYAEGFGSAAAEHWLGLNHVHKLTSTGNWTLRFDLTAFDGDTAWAEYDEFLIDDGTDFTMWYNKSSYRGTAGNSLDYSNGTSPYSMKFSTSRMDRDKTSDNCAEMYNGAWWYSNCMAAQTTGEPYGGSWSMYWDDFKGYVNLKAVTMKIWIN